MDRLDRLIWRLVDGAILMAVMGMVCLIALQVGSRLIGASVPWTEELSRFLRMSGSVAELKDFLALLPTSFHAKMSRSAPPQLQEIAKQVRPLLDRVKETDQMLYLLGWTRRLLATGEREGRTRS